jgi:hypothetical protein
MRRRGAHEGGAVGEATAWRQLAWHRGERGGGAVGEAPTWRQSVQHQGGCGGGVGTGGCVAGK